MTVLENSVRINASREKVWSALTRLHALHLYDPGIKEASIVSPLTSGIGATRRCNLTPGGWFEETIVEWRPCESVAFELVKCTLPVRRLTHTYALIQEGPATVVKQKMEYVLKFGLIGRLMDAMMVRKKWDAGIKSFFAGLKNYVETGERPPVIPNESQMARR